MCSSTHSHGYIFQPNRSFALVSRLCIILSRVLELRPPWRLSSLPRELFHCHVESFEGDANAWFESESACRWAKERTGISDRSTRTFIDPREARGTSSFCFLDWTCAAGASELAASEFLAALLSFGMGAEAAKSFARDREYDDFVLPNSVHDRPGPIAVAAFRLCSCLQTMRVTAAMAAPPAARTGARPNRT